MNTELFDTHCHLQDFYGKATEVWNRAKLAGITKCVIVGTNLHDAQNAAALAEKLSGSYLAVGIHPVNAGEPSQNISNLRAHFDSPNLVAIGESGLDYYRSRNPRKRIQFQSLREHLTAANDLGLPVIIHIRPKTNSISDTNEIHEDLINVLENSPRATCIIHCFVGTTEHAKKLIDLGHFISLAGNLTHLNDLGNRLRETVTHLPNDRLLIETDAPYIRPQGRKGRNEPAFVIDTLVALSKAKNTSAEEMAPTIWENSLNAFKLRSS